jgi:two-component system sensor histidine kinase KdpD
MSTDDRPNPDALLAQLQRDEELTKTGRLFIFLGMCPGVGKTYAMLQAARQRKAEGVNVLVGIVETHGRSETATLVEGLDVLPRLKLEHRGFEIEEFDIDAVLRLRPGLVLVDELAHTNAPGARHAKRYQDVLELIDAGIDVYTTLNVQHIESQVDVVQQITGVAIHETVPDSTLDRAHEIQLIDLSVEKLLERMAEGRVYMGERAEAAAQGFFKEGNLTALRELALRFTAEQVDRDLEDIRRARRVSSPWKTNARLMVGVGPSPYAESLIRWTRRSASRVGCPWLVVWVEGAHALKPEQQEMLARALGLARKLGGEVVSVTDDDVIAGLLRVAQERNVTQMVVGKPEERSFWRPSMADRLIAQSGDIDVCVVRPLAEPVKQYAGRIEEPAASPMAGEYSWVGVIMFCLISVCWATQQFTGYMFVALVFLLATVMTALRLSRGPVLFMATISALAWDYFFIPPHFTFYIQKADDFIMFGMFFIVALSMGSLTSRLRQRELTERRRQLRTAALLRVTQSAALAAESGKGLAEALRTINELLHADTALVVREGKGNLPKSVHSASTFLPMPKEWGVISWCHNNKQPAGRFTDTLPKSDATWFPLQTATSMMGVLGVHLHDDGVIDFQTRQTIEAFALQLALVLEKEHFIQAMQQAEMRSESDRLRKTLLDSVSHELKTPIAVMRAALDGIERTGTASAEPYHNELRIAVDRLHRVVESLLHMTRLEAEVVKPEMEWTAVDDLVQGALSIVKEDLAKHPTKTHVPADLPLVRVDAILLTQALSNILHNAASYTPEGTLIEISARMGKPHEMEIIVRDHGPGLPGGMQRSVFDKFVRGPDAPSGGTGLGLSIARGFVRAHGGDLTARTHPDGGAEFTLTLPVEILADPGDNGPS